MVEEVKHTGGCHCGAVRFQVFAPRDVTVYNCSCTICVKKGTRPFLVPEEKFMITKGEDNITTYSYNKHEAKHYFCKTCGIHSFYKPRSAPKGMARGIYDVNIDRRRVVVYRKNVITLSEDGIQFRGIEISCVDEGTIGNVTTICFDGVNYEETLAAFDKSLLPGAQ